MPTLCIQCAMKALLAGKPADPKAEWMKESIEEHMRKYHPDPIATKRERIELEKELMRDPKIKIGASVLRDKLKGE